MDKTLRPQAYAAAASYPANVASHMYWGDGSSVTGGVRTSLTMLKYHTKYSLGLIVPLRVYKTFLVDCNEADNVA